jgi:hypothetical protein
MIPGAIDVSLGGGEFGRGFYTQSSVANALTWYSTCRLFNKRAYSCWMLTIPVTQPSQN